MANYYNNLFSIEITTFGIIAATVIVFLEIVYSQYSYREIGLLIKNKYLVFYFIISSLSVLITAVGSLLLSFHKHDFIPQVNFHSRIIYESQYVATLLMVAFIFSLVLFAAVVITNIKHLKPSRILLLISNKIKTTQIRDYMLRKYGLPSPDKYPFNSPVIAAEYLRKTIMELGKEVECLSESEKQDIAEQEKKREIQLKKDRSAYEKLRKCIENAHDPFEPLEAFVIKAITNLDLMGLREAEEVMVGISKKFIETYKETNQVSNCWNPHYRLVDNFINYFADRLRLYLVLCDRQNLNIAKLSISRMSNKILPSVFDKLSGAGGAIIMQLWKEVADDAIQKSPQVFKEIMQYYREAGVIAFEQGEVDNNENLNDVYRGLGWLGERLLQKSGIESKPLMYDADYSSEYDYLHNTLFHFNDLYETNYPESYPLIYFDAVSVVCKHLLIILKDRTEYEVKSKVSDCLYTYTNFAEKAILKDNGRGAALGVIRLKECYDQAFKLDIEEVAADIIKIFVRIAGLAASYKDTLGYIDFLGATIDEYLINIIEKSPFVTSINGTVIELLIKSHSKHEQIWKFITTLGIRLKTNFGLMFDPVTGETYPDDDPRRKM